MIQYAAAGDDVRRSAARATVGGFPGRTRESDDQINVQLPWEIGTGSGVVNVIVNTPNGASAPVAVNFAPSTPGIFTAPESGKLYAVAVNFPDNSLAWPQGLVQGAHPAKAGDTLVIYATGFGAVDHTPGVQ